MGMASDRVVAGALGGTAVVVFIADADTGRNSLHDTLSGSETTRLRSFRGLAFRARYGSVAGQIAPHGIRGRQSRRQCSLFSLHRIDATASEVLSAVVIITTILVKTNPGG